MEPVRLFLYPLADARRVGVFEDRTFEQETKVVLYGDNRTLKREGFEVVESIEEADFVVVPNSTRHLTPSFMAHVGEARALAEAHHKPLILFISGDLSFRLHIDNAIVFKPSIYAHGKRWGEITSAPLARDLSTETPLVWRQKSEKPSVSFCGYAGFPHIKTRIKYEVVNAGLNLASVVLGRPDLRARKRGIYFRRKGLALLGADSRIDTRFVIRNAFFHQAGVDNDPVRMHQEFLSNMSDTDFVLCPKGDGNYSIRFFETLSLGRIPILIDTDMALPLEGELDYSKFVLRIPHTELHTLPDRVVELYSSLSSEEFKAMQQAARDAYVHYLRQDKFYSRAFALLKAHGPEAL